MRGSILVLYLLDYHGTLSTLEDPEGFLRSLRSTRTQVVVMSGGFVPKTVLEAADGFWQKSGIDPLPEIREKYEKVFVSDDYTLFLKALTRRLSRVLPNSSVLAVPPSDLLLLLEEVEDSEG